MPIGSMPPSAKNRGRSSALNTKSTMARDSQFDRSIVTRSSLIRSDIAKGIEDAITTKDIILDKA